MGARGLQFEHRARRPGLRQAGRLPLPFSGSFQLASRSSIVRAVTTRLAQLACLLLALCLAGCKRGDSSKGPSDEFLRLMVVGKNHLERGDATNAIATYKKA